MIRPARRPEGRHRRKRHRVASAARRPGHEGSYTANFPFEPLAGNRPTGAALLWSGLSLIALLGGADAALLIFGRFEQLGWITNRPTFGTIGRHALPDNAIGAGSLRHPTKNISLPPDLQSALGRWLRWPV